MKKVLYFGFLAILLFVFVACDSGGGKLFNETTVTTTATNVTTLENESSEMTEATEIETTENEVEIDYSSDVKTLLENAGYAFTARDSESIAYYTQNTALGTYQVNVTITSLYLGYVNSTERWCEMIGFATADQAETFYNAVVNIDASGMLVWYDENVVVLTFSQDTIDALNS